MAKAEWRVGPYNFYYLDLPYRQQVVVGWEGEGYAVSFGSGASVDPTLKARPKDLAEAKKLGVAFARKILNATLEALPEEK